MIGATTTKAGLRVESALDTRTYQKGIKVGRAEMNRLDITGDPFHPESNYTIRRNSLPRHTSGTVAVILRDVLSAVAFDFCLSPNAIVSEAKLSCR